MFKNLLERRTVCLYRLHGGYEYDAAIKYLLITGFKKYLITKERTEELLVDYEAEEDHEKVFIKFDDIKIVEKISEDRAKNIIYGKVKTSDLTQDTLQMEKGSCLNA